MKYYTQEWYEAVQRSVLDSSLKNHCEAAPKEYVKLLKQQHIPEAILSRLKFHDSVVLEIKRTVDCFTLTMDESSWGYHKIQFFTPKISRQDEGIVGSEWLYEEIYRIPNGYEMHVLFFSRKLLDLVELIVQCDSIEIE